MEESKFRYVKYHRKPEAGPGHATILVLEDQKGIPQVFMPGKTEIRVATEDRIPFTLKPGTLRAHYSRGTQ